jgi:SAM-dependent methyltransferase
MKTIRGTVYDHPKYYDVLFNADWKAEFTFLVECFRRHARRAVRRLYEPACGTGRLLIKFAKARYEVSGIDLNSQAVAYCNARLIRHGFPPSVTVGDMADFRLPRKVDAAFNTINSFRHLDSEAKAQSHLRCVSRALSKGGLYVLGIHLTPLTAPNCTEESWTAQRGRLTVNSHMESIKLDRQRRQEHLSLVFDISTPTRRFRVKDEFVYRTYTAEQFRRLLGRIGDLELVETYDFNHNVETPIRVNHSTEDVIYVLRKN